MAREAREAATKKLSAKGQATLAKGQAAVTKHRERKLQAQRMAAPGEMQQRWRSQGGGGGGHGQPALAGVSDAPGGKSTAAIGKPSVMQMAGGASTRGLGLRPDAEAALEKLENIKKDPVGEINSEKNHNHYSAARTEAKGTQVAINKKTRKAYSHIRDLQEASKGLDNVLAVLKQEIDHPPATITSRGINIVTERYSEAQQMQNRLKGFLNSIGYGKFPPFHSF